MSGKIFLNYRRVDSDSWTLLLREKLIAQLGADRLFHDLSGVPLGARVRPYLAAQVADCAAMITVIGPQWLEILRERREGDAPDHVLIEIEEALRYVKAIIPVLVGGARMPTASDLPHSIRPLADRAGMTLAPERLDADVSALLAGLARILQAATAEGRIVDSHVAMAAGGQPILVAKGHIRSQPTLRVNQTPLRAAQAAERATHTPATSQASVTTANVTAANVAAARMGGTTMTAKPGARRFRIAFSFAGEKRDFVEQAAHLLATKLGEQCILYDKFHEAEFARHDLGMYLPKLYGEQSDLIVPVLCPNYESKRWTGWEWLHIYGLLTKADGYRVMPCRFERAPADGLSPAAGFVELDRKTPAQFVTLILQRLAHNEGKPRDHYCGAPAVVADAVTAPEPQTGWRFCRDKDDVLRTIERRVRATHPVFTANWAAGLKKALQAKDEDLVSAVRDHAKPREVIDILAKHVKDIPAADVNASGIDELMLFAACRCINFAKLEREPVGTGETEEFAALTRIGSDLELLTGICVAGFCGVRLYVNEAAPDLGYSVTIGQGKEADVLHAALTELYPQILGRQAPVGRKTSAYMGDLGLWFEEQRKEHHRVPVITVICTETESFHRTIAINLAKRLNHVVNYRRDADPSIVLDVVDQVEIFHARIKRCLEALIHQAAAR